MSDNTAIVDRMTMLAAQWQERQDKRAIFLRCYSMMTGNMLKALKEKRFQDNDWVEKLLHRFADYYFEALACFDCGENVPMVWQNVHEAAASEKLHVVQHLLLGINAHINYDLVLTIEEMLRDEWPGLSKEQRQMRYEDHCLVNTIIGETIDKVQDEVVEEHSPIMDMIDKAMGRLDERLLVGLISRWRKSVWDNAVILLECQEEKTREECLKRLEERVLENAGWLGLGR